MLNTKKVAVLIPCYNEERSIKRVVEDFRKALPGAAIYVYDNASEDNTAAVAASAGAIVRHEPLRGKANVVRNMFRDVEADYYIMVDGDGSCDSGIVATLLERCIQENLEMLVGARQPASEQKPYRPGHVFGNRMLNKIIEFFFAKRFKDVLSGYRVLSRRFVKSFPVLSEGFELETEMTVYALSLKLRVDEHPVTFFARTRGTESKLRTYKDGLRILLFIVRLFKDYRPLILFSFLALITFAITLFFFIPILIHFLETGTVSRIPTLIMCGAGSVLTLLALFTGFILDSISRGTLKAGLSAYLQASFKSKQTTVHDDPKRRQP